MKKLFLATLIAISPTISNAATFSFGFNAGEVNSIDAAAPAALQAFQLGEDIFVDFTFEDTLAPGATGGDNANFFDPAGTMTFTGVTSGAMLMLTGVDIQFDESDGFEIQSILDDPTLTDPIILSGDIDVDPNGSSNPPFFSDPTDLAGNLALFTTLFNADGNLNVPNFDSLDAQLSFFDGDSNPVGLDFGPVVQVPLPASLPLLLGALGLIGLNARRRRT